MTNWIDGDLHLGKIPSGPKHALRIEIHGAVQGVGFRPFVYRLALELGLTGWVLNDGRGVFIEIEGPATRLEQFLARLEAEKPVHALIYDLTVTPAPSVGYANFTIHHSEDQGAKTVLVLPDLATCPACLADIQEPANRRFRYPFTNCTVCGPRFSIVLALPYDRPNTTMSHFPLCPACQAEYEDPTDRRFHAQPNACPLCGPQLAFYARGDTPARVDDPTSSTFPDSWRIRECGGNPISLDRPAATADRWPAEFAGWRLHHTQQAALVAAADALCAGAIVGVKGLGGFQLLVDARNSAAVERLRQRKPRPDKPFAVMARDLDQARLLVEIAPAAAQLLAGATAPIVLLPRQPASPVAEVVTPGNPNLGVMLPYTPLHHLLLQAIDFPVVATSGNVTDEPICTDEWDAMTRLGHAADGFLIHDRPIARHVDDSVLWIVDGQSQFLRRARGYAPLPIRMAEELPTILAVGAHLKNTVALSVGRQIFISQHVGDLENAPALVAFERVIGDFLRLYAANPVAIAHDLHPDYLSTRWAVNQTDAPPAAALDSAVGPQLIPVQHHYAHLASCLADNRHTGPALGVIWDGTGYGPDGTIWGGEFLLGDARGYQRVAHLRPFRLPGGDAAVREPRRVALALLWEAFGEAVLDWEHLVPVRAHTAQERRILGQMLARSVNSPMTTSAGRLFDGIAALLGLHQVVSFEGQAAMALEFACDPTATGAYPLPLIATGPTEAAYQLDWQPLVAAIVEDLERKVALGVCAARFHNAVVSAIAAVTSAVGASHVALSGGCFQNRRLTEQTADHLRQAGFTVLLHRHVPPNDGGISLGQIAVAGAFLRGEGREARGGQC